MKIQVICQDISRVITPDFRTFAQSIFGVYQVPVIRFSRTSGHLRKPVSQLLRFNSEHLVAAEPLHLYLIMCTLIVPFSICLRNIE